MASIELSEKYIQHTIDQFERDHRLDKIKDALRRAAILLLSLYSFDGAAHQLVGNELSDDIDG